MIKEDTSMNFMRFYLITKEDRWQFRLCEPLPGIRRKKKGEKGGNLLCANCILYSALFQAWLVFISSS